MARPESRAVWDRFASKKGLYESRVRDAVIDAFFATSEHVDLQALFEAARRRHPRVGLATVYRTMKLLDEAGLAQPCRFENGRGTVYEVADARHDHLICDECGQIVEFTDDDIGALQSDIAARHGFTLLRRRHELYGRCRACREST